MEILFCGLLWFFRSLWDQRQPFLMVNYSAVVSYLKCYVQKLIVFECKFKCNCFLSICLWYSITACSHIIFHIKKFNRIPNCRLDILQKSLRRPPSLIKQFSHPLTLIFASLKCFNRDQNIVDCHPWIGFPPFWNSLEQQLHCSLYMCLYHIHTESCNDRTAFLFVVLSG